MKVRSLGNKIPEIRIDINAYNKIMEATNICDNEIALLGCVKKENNAYIIYDAIIIEQQVHSTTAEITEEGLSKLALELVAEENGIQKWNDIKVWYHSHVNMSTTPSGQDEKQMDLFIQNNEDYFIRMIGNKKEELKIDLYSIENGVIYEDIPFKMQYEEDVYKKIITINNQIKILKERMEELISIPQDLKESIAKEIKEKVTEKKTFVNTNHNYGYGYGYGTQEAWWNKSKKNTKSTKEEDVKTIFASLSETDIYAIKEAIDFGGTSLDMLEGVYDMTLQESYELDELIEQYVEDETEDFYNITGK